jgi:phage tail sheath gpL-like
MVDFNEIPAVNKSPAVFAEFDPIGAPGTDIHTLLVVGYRLSSATVPALTPVLTTGATEGDGQHGAGSQLARILRAIKRVNRTSRVISIGVAEPSGGTAASGNIAVGGTTASADGSYKIYIGGTRIEVAIASGDTDVEAAAAIEAAIDAATDALGLLPVTATATDDDVVINCRWKGVDGNQIDIAKNLRAGESDVPGLALTITAMASGAGGPTLSDVVAILEEQRYDDIVLGAGLSADVDDMIDEVARRWGATVNLDGHVWVAIRGSLGAMTTIGDGLNAPELTVLGIGLSPSEPWVAAGQAAALNGTISNPGLPRFGLVMPDVVAPIPASRLDHSERNLALLDGISTIRVDSGGRVVIDRLVTTWQENTFGGEDDTWEALTTRQKAAYLRRDWVAYVQARYPDYMLADDGTVVDPGVKVITPSVIAGEALAWYQEKMREGHVDNFDGFRAALAASRPSGDPTRIDLMTEPSFTNELVTIATKMAFRI